MAFRKERQLFFVNILVQEMQEGYCLGEMRVGGGSDVKTQYWVL